MGSNKDALKQRDKAVARGRTQGLSKEYQPRFCKVVVNQGRQGKSRTQIAVYLGVSRKRLKAWEKEHPEFAEAMEIALDYARAWWENKAQRSLGQKHFQAGMLAKMMASRFPDEYSERMVHAGDEEAPLTVITRRIIDARQKSSDDER
jgi:DNA-binding XRE family transcriptional regulator